MITFRGTTNFYMEGPTALTLGKFDGVHLGHQKLMQKISAFCSRTPGASSAVFAINPGNGTRILTPEEQIDTIGQLGIGTFIDCPFIPEISSMTPVQFVREVLCDRLHAAYIAVGTDFRFAHRREGNAAFLQENASRFGLEVDVIEKETYAGTAISSSRIRDALSRGDVRLAAALMGRCYSLEGTVVRGRHLGTKLGMPTANIIPDSMKLLPAYGVYVSRTLMDGKAYGGVTNVGVKPTVDGSFAGAETYLFDYGKAAAHGGAGPELYDRRIRVELLSFLRPEKRFDSLDMLRGQIAEDIEAGKAAYVDSDIVLF